MTTTAMVAKATLSETPRIDPSARVRDSILGEWTSVGPRTTIAESTLGDYTYVVNDSSIIYSQIGKFCSIAAHTRINPGNHPLDRAALHHFTYRSPDFGLGPEPDEEFFEWRRSDRVTFGDDVWIGHGAIVLPGVTLGTGSALGAGAVATKDIPPFAVAVGVPARVIRFRFDQRVQDALLDLAWWNWSRERLADALPDFRALGAEEFVEKYGR